MNPDTNFSEKYSKVYDGFHQNKNYRREVQQLLGLLSEEYFENHPKSVLDFGCGTGLHLEQLQKLGFSISGFDISEPMLELARSRVKFGNFYNNLNEVPVNFGLTVSLFDVLSYQSTLKQFEEMFEALKSKTSAGASIIVDSWQLEGVLLDPPRVSMRTITVDGILYSREVSPIQVLRSPDSPNGVTYELLVKVLDETNQIVVSEENHRLRPWSRSDIKAIAEKLNLTQDRAFNPLNFGESTDKDWRFGVILRNSD